MALTINLLSVQNYSYFQVNEPQIDLSRYEATVYTHLGNEA
ncbi:MULTISPECIES: hypothetical protein [unclassified Nostoc]|nr:hypothetical protein [Nostoc sp. DedQUE03]MDZ8043304.1 hypothetical protein [Nostoc sp. DedQUE02]